jgi:hypothetical protein
LVTVRRTASLFTPAHNHGPGPRGSDALATVLVSEELLVNARRFLDSFCKREISQWPADRAT